MANTGQCAFSESTGLEMGISNGALTQDKGQPTTWQKLHYHVLASNRALIYRKLTSRPAQQEWRIILAACRGVLCRRNSIKKNGCALHAKDPCYPAFFLYGDMHVFSSCHAMNCAAAHLLFFRCLNACVSPSTAAMNPGPPNKRRWERFLLEHIEQTSFYRSCF